MSDALDTYLLPPAAYTEESWLRAEQEALFERTWTFAGVAQDLAAGERHEFGRHWASFETWTADGGHRRVRDDDADEEVVLFPIPGPAFEDIVNVVMFEDCAATEAIQRALRAPSFAVGPIATDYEREIARFQRHSLEFVTPPNPEATP